MRLLGVLFSALLLASPVWAADSYPSRLITLIVPLAPGSGTDTVARVVAKALGDELGQQIVVENKVGANGAIGSAFVGRAAPDGYTLLIGGTTTHAGNPSLMKNLAYDPVKSFTAVNQLGVYPYALMVSGTGEYKTLAALVAAAKAAPGALSFAYANALGQLSGELLKNTAGVNLNAVAYRGSPQAITDIIGGRVTMMFSDVLPAVGHLEAGTLRALAVTTAERTALLPNVPTMAESGFPGPRVEAWSGIFAPANTPKPVVDRLSAAITKVMARPEMRQQLAAMGFEAQTTAPDVFARRVADEVALWATLTKQAGLEAQ